MTIKELQEKLIDDIIKDIPLPPKPDILLRFMREKQRDLINIDNFTEILSGDMALSLSLLKTINSAFFGLTNEVRSINHAMSMLGLENVSNLVLAFSLKKSLDNSESYLLKDFWADNSTIALISASLASTYTRVNRDLAYTFCLICDCGIPTIMRKEKGYEEFYKESNSQFDFSLVELEEDEYMYNHAKVGSYLFKEWGLSESLVLATRYHHELKFNTLDLSHEIKSLIAIRNVAEYVFKKHKKQNVAYEQQQHTIRASLKLLDLNERGLPNIQESFNLLLDNMD